MFPYPVNEIVDQLITAACDDIASGEFTLSRLLRDLEDKIIMKTYIISNKKKKLTSKRLGISRVKLDYKLKEYKVISDA